MAEIEYHKEHGYGVITLNRVDKKNALTLTMYQQITDGLRDADTDPDIAAVLIRAKGDCFCAGNDLVDFSQATEQGDVAMAVTFMRTLINFSKPVVAQVQGQAVGIGCTLLLHCDLVYCQSDSRFKLPFIDLALVPEFAASYVLPRIVGHHKAAQWLMLGEAFDATDALRAGLVNRICPVAELADVVAGVMQNLASKDRTALLLTKKLMLGDQQQMMMHLDEELDLFIQQLHGPAAQAAFQRFLQR